MRKYRKKPIVIEAVQLTASAFDAPHPNEEHIVGIKYDPTCRCALIDTLEGQMRASLGDWIIRGVAGELYPCKDSIFRQTYEPVEYTVEDVHAETLALMANDNLSDLTIASLRSRLEEKFGGLLVDAARRSIMEGQ